MSQIKGNVLLGLAGLLLCIPPSSVEASVQDQIETVDLDAIPISHVAAEPFFREGGSLERPAAVAVHDNTLLVLDSGLHAVFSFSSDGSLASSQEVPHEPWASGATSGASAFLSDLQPLHDGTFLILESNPCRLMHVESGKVEWQSPIGHEIRSFTLSCEGDEIVYPSSPLDTNSLISIRKPQGRTAKEIGEKFSPINLSDAATLSIYSRVLAHGCEGRTVVALQRAPVVLLYDGAQLQRAIILSGEHVDHWQQKYREMLKITSLAGVPAKSFDRPVEMLGSFFSDTELACLDGEPHGPYYIGGLEVYQDRILVLLVGLVVELNMDLEVTAVYKPIENGDHEIPVHDICISEHGDLFLMDMMHYSLCYTISATELR